MVLWPQAHIQYMISYMESSVVFGIKCYLEVYIKALY